MEPKKKHTCCCFSFLRRNSPKPVKPSVQSSIRPEIENFINSSPSEDTKINRTYSYSNKKSEIKSSIRSCIVTPIRRTPNLNKVIQSAINKKSDMNNSLETSISRPNTLQQLLKPQQKPGTPVQVSKGLLRNELKIVAKEAIKQLETELVIKKYENPHFMASPGPSPDWFSNASKFVSPALDSIGMSPIKNEDIKEDFSDIEGILCYTERVRQVPNVFFMNGFGRLKMPVIKPTTPGFFAKKKVLPMMRKDNRNMLNELKVCE